MADLPAARLAAYTRPFAHVGVDFFGQIAISVDRRVEKRWGISFYSNRGTNFVGANRDIMKTVGKMDQIHLMREFVTPSTAWQFNPPASPHMSKRDYIVVIVNHEHCTNCWPKGDRSNHQWRTNLQDYCSNSKRNLREPNSETRSFGSSAPVRVSWTGRPRTKLPYCINTMLRSR